MAHLDSVTPLSTARRYCGWADHRTLHELVVGSRQTAPRPAWPQLQGGQTLLTYQGRTAIAWLCQYWQIGAEDEVLVPAYNCGTEIDPFLRSGARVTMYRVNDQAAIDVQDIRRRAGSRTRLVYVTHYFGWPQDLAELAAWCWTHNLHLVEDCALALFSNAAEMPGVIGDAAIFSFPKFLAVPDGGALVLRSGDHAMFAALGAPARTATCRKTLGLLKGGALQLADRLGLYPLARAWLGNGRRANGSRPDAKRLPLDYYYAREHADWGPSWITRATLANTRPDHIRTVRRTNYLHLTERLRGVAELRPLFDELPPGVCPAAFPVRVGDRDRWVRELNRRGIAAVAWWSGYHRGLCWDAFPAARELKDSLVALPIHQGLSTGHIRYMAESVTAIARCPASRA